MARSALLNVMVQAATKAGRSLTRDFNEVENLQVSVKGPGDFVSAADKRAEEIIHRELEKARPGYSFLMEESGTVKGTDPFHRWIIDPLDGTTNFLHSLPLFAVCIALERQGQIVAGVIYNPITEELFTAEKGQGAFLNDKRLRVASRKRLDDAIVATGYSRIGMSNHGTFLAEMKIATVETAAVRGLGSAALCLAYVAAGRLDAAWLRNLQAWDLAAGIVLVREAGGFVSDLTGGERMLDTGGIIVGNETMRDLVRDRIVKPVAV